VALQDVIKIAGIGLVIALLHMFFEHSGKKEFAFFLFFVAYLYMTIELLRFLRTFLQEVGQFLNWLAQL
jgi:hypothetical protein